MLGWSTWPAVLLVAAANGANDNSKGVATLVGSGAASTRTAIVWGTLATLAGSLAALGLSGKMLQTFSGVGLVSDALVGMPSFVTAVALGTAGTVLLATWMSMPISTTHALTGSLLGAGLALGGDVRLAVLGDRFFAPLLVSPVVALALTAMLYPVLRKARLALGITRRHCVCVEDRWVPVEQLTSGDGSAARQFLPTMPAVSTCQERYEGAVLAVGAQEALDWAHYLSAGATSFARGLNDTPKIVAVLLAAGAAPPAAAFALIAMAMALGGFLGARRVSETMSQRITTMNHGQGFTANVVTACLVLFASRLGLPVSTTHVSCGSLFGLGAVTGAARWKMVGGIALAWVFTLPLAVVLSAIAARAIGR